MPTAPPRTTYRDRHEPEYSDYDSYASDYPTPPPVERRPRPRRKSTTQSIVDRVSRSIGRLGINRSPSRTRHSSPAPAPRRPAYPRHRSSDSYYPPSARPRNVRHSSSYSLSPPRSRQRGSRAGGDRTTPAPPDRRLQHAARSAFDAAVVEAMRVRKEPGSWAGGKGARVATAALGAAAVNAFVDKDPDARGQGKKTTVQSALGGLLLNRVVNGPRKELRREERGRGRR